MLKKPLRRVKRKKGAVLFAVISVMALLIAMASTAYFTAKNAYNSVISNYSYSQLYLSAISVADMVSEAVTNNNASGASATNYYTSLRNAITAMKTEGETVSAYSENISNPAASEAEILEQIAESEVSTVPGALDGVIVKITLDKIVPTDDGTGAQKTTTSSSPKGKYKHFDFTYTFSTTAYYRGSAIVVEDIVKAEQKQFEPDPDNPDPNPQFGTFFTATGQDGIVIQDGEAKYEVTERVIKIKSHEISDDAFFENKTTFFVAQNDNKFLGGITSVGDIYLEKFSTSISGDYNDWWIGGDLVMTNSMANNLNLTNQNSIYVRGDLVLSNNGGASITAEDIYVLGDLYILCQANINGNLHVAGNIYYEMDTNGNGSPPSEAYKTCTTNSVSFDTTRYGAYGSNGWSVSGNLDVNGKIVLPEEKGEWDPSYAKFTVGGQQVQIEGGSNASSNDKIGTFIPSGTTVTVQTQTSTGTGYTESSQDMSLLAAFNLKETTDNSGSYGGGAYAAKDPDKDGATQGSPVGALESTDYDAYTAKDAYNKTVTVDFEALEPVYVEDVLDHYECTSNGVTIKTASDDLEGEIIVDLPYESSGYILDIKTDSSGNLTSNGHDLGKAEITYNIPTGSENSVMPIVLAPNMSSADGGEKDSFSWRGASATTGEDSSGNQIVIGAGKTSDVGYVVFEMANMDKDGNLVAYDINKRDELSAVTYVAGSKEVVGTKNQIDKLGTDGYMSQTERDSMLGTGSNPASGCENHVMLVSNKVGGTGFDAERNLNVFCGYVYTPNSEFSCIDTSGGAETRPVFGGLIASTYNASNTFYDYVAPNPTSMTDTIFSALKRQSLEDIKLPDDNNNDDEEEEEDDDPTYEFVNDSWAHQGSNYLG